MKYCDQCHSTYPTEFTTCPKDQAALRLLTELQSGVIIRDKYEVLDKVGVGGMATVYRAKHLTFNEIRAIKVVSNKLMDDVDFLQRFKTEAIITRKLKHPNAVQLDDFDTTADGRPFIVMEFVQGRNLRAWIHDMRTIPLQRALNIAKHVASALGAAHKLGIVHRDIKPDNIIVIPQGNGSDVVKVFDFGIAKMTARGPGGMEAHGSTATQPGMVVGTPQYVSPEQASGKIGDQIDGRSDLYSLGIVLYEMLTGRLPFISDTPVGYLIHHLNTAPTPPAALKPAVRLPDTVNALLMKALEKDRNQRFQSAEEFISALDKPHALVATAVMGSETMPAARTPSRPPAGAPAVMRSSDSPSSSSWKPQSSPSWKPQAVAATPAPTLGTVYGDPGETVWQGGRKPRPATEWNRIAAIGAVVLVMVIAIGGFFRYMASRRALADTTASSADSDAQIKQDILDSFGDSDSLRGHAIQVRVENGNVTLSGKVDKPYLTEIAGALAHNVSGVKNLQNNIEVIEVEEREAPVWRSESDAPQPSTRPKAQPRQAAQPLRDSQPPWQQSQPIAGVSPQPPNELQQALQNQERQFVMRGYQRLQAGQFPGAEHAFRNALRIDPNNRFAQQGLQRALKGRRGMN